MGQTQFRSDDTVKWWGGFGRGIDGDLTISSNTIFSQVHNSLTISSGNTQTTTSMGNFSSYAGRYVLLYQTRGSGSGNWELNQIESIDGSDLITFKDPVKNTYNDSGNDQSQCILMREYENVTVNSGVTWSAPAWNGNFGGIIVFFAKKKVTVNGTINVSGKGFRGGAYDTSLGGWGGYGGEGMVGYSGRGGWTGSSGNGALPSGGGWGNSSNYGTGASGAQYYTGGGGGGGNDGNGGDEGGAAGGGGGNYWGGGGGGVGNDSSSPSSPAGDGGSSVSYGGGNGGSGTQANGSNSGSASSTYSAAGGNGQSGAGCNGGGGGGGANAPHVGTELTKIFYGGGGGAGGNYGISNQRGGRGGTAGGIVLLIAKEIEVTGTISANGDNGEMPGVRGGSGGGGAAGSVLMKCQTAVLGTSKVVANGGVGGGAWYSAGGGNGSRGVIHVDYKTSVSGTTSPTLSTRQDLTLNPAMRNGAFMLTNFI